ncbi:MAG: phytanoyl-CoA dioxygenase, partial [Chitinophagaceae bacterium]
TTTIQTARGFTDFSPEVQQQLLSWKEKGFMVLPHFFDDTRIDEAAQSVLPSLSQKEKQKYFSNRIINLYKKNKQIESLFKDEQLVNILSFILGREIAPFQTINFYKSGSQAAHSDAVHLTTEPLGFALGVWVALEDVTEGSGEFFYYPGSHKLHYILNKDFATEGKSWAHSEDLHEKYEKRVADLIEEKGLKYETFLPKKGDVLIWHTNLLHGSLPKLNLQLTRVSLIMHYFAQGVLCYHEMLEKPAVF